METMVSPAQFLALSRQEQATQWQTVQQQLTELADQRAEVDRLKARLAEIEPFWQLHEARREGRRLTRRIRREVEDPAQRAQQLIAAREQGLLVSKPTWEELSALMASQTDSPPDSRLTAVASAPRLSANGADPGLAHLPPLEDMARMSVDEIADCLITAHFQRKDLKGKGIKTKGMTNQSKASLRQTLMNSGIPQAMHAELHGGEAPLSRPGLQVGVPYPEISRQQRREQERTDRRLAEKAARKRG